MFANTRTTEYYEKRFFHAPLDSSVEEREHVA